MRKILRIVQLRVTYTNVHVNFIDIDDVGTIRTLPLGRYMQYRATHHDEFMEPLKAPQSGEHAMQELENLLQNCPLDNCSIK